ncbi:MAG: recombinase family protein [Solirubrobacteraceae bacterium]
MRVERERDVDLNVLQQQIDTSTAAGRMLFAMLDAVGEFERDPLSERTRDGLRASRARGRTGDRKSKLKAAHGQPARPMLGELDDGLRWPHTVQDIARQAAGDKGPAGRRRSTRAGPAGDHRRVHAGWPGDDPDLRPPRGRGDGHCGLGSPRVSGVLPSACEAELCVAVTCGLECSRCSTSRPTYGRA